MSHLSKKKILRVNADDFGFTKGITDGILHAHLNGIVTHTSIMAQGLDFERAAKIAKATPTLGFGVHLTISWGQSVAPAERIPTLLNSERRFFTFGQVTLRSLMGRIDPKQLYAEWAAQLEKVLDVGLVLTHLDSHHHMHLLPTFFPVIRELSQYYQIPYIRKPLELINLKEPSLIKRIIFYVLCMRAWPRPTSDTFYGLSLQKSGDYSRTLKEIIKEIPSGITELMVHPGWVDDDLRREDSMGASREKELTALCDPTLKGLLMDRGITLSRP
jgi:chitin disaccharide deacetylase